MKRQWKNDDIAKWVKSQKSQFSSQDLIKRFGMSRQTAARLLRDLTNSNKLIKTGSTQKARYSLAKSKVPQSSSSSTLSLKKVLRGLAEDKVFDEVALKLGLKKALNENTFGIAYYAFSEMLNNAIDHSKSKHAEIHIGVAKGAFNFRVVDKGIGIFKNIRQGFALKSDEEAIEHLLKGKQTTAPSAHSGQGIFFTSKIADCFQIRSGKFTLTFDNENKDLKLADSRVIKGTEVSFKIKLQTRKSLERLFKEYANDDFEFDRTTYPIILLKQNGAVSRSQARRLTSGLENFDRIILDFAEVKELGQGFADEIFRVFQSRFPQMVIEKRNASSAVDFMIRRAQASGTAIG